MINSTGTKIALSIYESKKENPCIVFVPGTMSHPLLYDDFLSLLPDRGFNVIGIHLISHGKSPREKMLYSFEDMIENVLDAITYCIDTFNDRVVLLGSSQGGILSLAVAGKDSRLKAVFPHNILLPDHPDTITITRFPHFLKYFHSIGINLIKIIAKTFPTMQISVTSYLDLKRVSSSREVLDQFFHDPLLFTKYPLYFLASLFTADFTSVTDGSIKCPVILIASKREALFPYSYCLDVFERIKAPRKEILAFNEEAHLIFQECVDRIIDPIAEKMREYS